MRTGEYRSEYDRLIKSGDFPDILTGKWDLDKDIFISMQVSNDLLLESKEDYPDDLYLDDEYIGY